jgi:pimeloyl-ACP methyl ester carboxylesterase
MRADGMTGYRSFRLLANMLAEAGYPTLRFDYPDTGDSRDLAGSDHWVEWQRSIHNAANWMREHCSARRVVLIGLRFGALLAATVAEQRADIAGLVLLAPVLRGRSFIRELSTESSFRGDVARNADGLSIHELRLSGHAVRQIQQVDLRKAVLARGCPVAVYAQIRSPVLSDCVSAWTRGGAEVTCGDFAGFEPLLRPAHLMHEPSANVSRVVTWLRQAVPLGPVPRRDARVPARAEIRQASYVETPVRFGANGDLFGVLCRPPNAVHDGMAIIIVNSSGNPHQGLARVNVDLARRLAAEGFASLRMDFAGLGDSVAPGDPETHVFETDRCADVAAAIDELENLGYRRFAIQGLCSGAYHAFHAAVADPRVGILLLVNMPLFRWRNGDAIEFLSHVLESPVNLLLQLRQKDVWMRLLRQGSSALRTRLAMQLTWVTERVTALARRHASRLGFGPPPTFAQECVRRLAQRTRTLFLFSEGDAGIAALDREFGTRRPPPGTELRVVPGLDHALTDGDMRRIVVEYMAEFLTRDARRSTLSPSLETAIPGG